MSSVPASVYVALAVTDCPSNEGSGETVTVPMTGGAFVTVWLTELLWDPVSSSVTVTVTV